LVFIYIQKMLLTVNNDLVLLVAVSDELIKKSFPQYVEFLQLRLFLFFIFYFIPSATNSRTVIQCATLTVSLPFRWTDLHF
jgi:hypothetical protein